MTGTASSTTQTLVTTAAVPAGGKILLGVSWFTATTISGVSDGANTYTVDKMQTSPSTTNCRFAVVSADCPAGLASGSSIVVTFAVAATNRYIGGAYSTGLQTGVGAAYGAVGSGLALRLGAPVTRRSLPVTCSGAAVTGKTASTTNTPSGGDTELQDFAPGAGSSM